MHECLMKVALVKFATSTATKRHAKFCHHCQFEKEAALLQRNMKMAGKVDK